MLDAAEGVEHHAAAGDVLDKQVLERLITERALHAVREGQRHPRRRHDGRAHDPAHRRGEQAQARRVPQGARAREASPTRRIARTSAGRSIVQRLREREVDSKIVVSDAEVDNYLATVAAQAGGEDEYLLSHVYVTVPEQATPDADRGAAQARGGRRLRRSRRARTSREVAAAYSDAPDATSGGSLGWRTPARLPSVFADVVRTMKKGDVSASPAQRRRLPHREARRRAQPQPADGRRPDARAAHPDQGQRDDVGSRRQDEDRPAARSHRRRRQVRGPRARQLRGRVERQGRRPRLDLAGRHRARFRARDGRRSRSTRCRRRCARRSAGT